MSDSSKAWLIGVLIASVTVLFGVMGYTSFLNEKKALSELRSEVTSLNKRLDTFQTALTDQGGLINETLGHLVETNKNLKTLQDQEHKDFMGVMRLVADQKKYINEIAELANLLSKRALSKSSQ